MDILTITADIIHIMTITGVTILITDIIHIITLTIRITILTTLILLSTIAGTLPAGTRRFGIVMGTITGGIITIIMAGTTSDTGIITIAMVIMEDTDHRDTHHTEEATHRKLTVRAEENQHH